MRWTMIGALLGVVFMLAACQSGTTDPDAIPSATSAPQSASEVSSIIPLDQVKKSQAGSVTQTVATTEIAVTYNRPVARGRNLFGGIVPYGEIWNPGADQATAVAFSRNVQINSRPLPAGKYSIWAIPGADQWTVIFSKAADVFHTPYPGEQRDALRITVVPETGTHMETLAFYFPVVEGKDAVLRLHWGEVMVPMRLQVD